MKLYQLSCILVVALLLLLAEQTEAKRRKHKGSDQDKSEQRKTKTKTKWSSSTDLGAANTQVSTEEHGYYVKRTFTPSIGGEGKRQSPPYLAIPIAWFSCEGQAGCQSNSNSAAINDAAHALSQGYLCDDDCQEPYEPICGKTSNEVAVFYNKCKLNVAKCRTHGMWQDLPYEQCKQMYAKETTYADGKFKASPYFKCNASVTEASNNEKKKSEQIVEKNKAKDSSEEQQTDKKPELLVAAAKPTDTEPMEAAMSAALDEISAKLSEAEKAVASQGNQQQAKPKADKDKLKYQVV